MKTLRRIDESGMVLIGTDDGFKEGDIVEVCIEKNGDIILKKFCPEVITFTYKTSGKFYKISAECDDEEIDIVYLTDKPLSSEEVLENCQWWMDEKELYDIQYKIFMEVH